MATDSIGSKVAAPAPALGIELFGLHVHLLWRIAAQEWPDNRQLGWHQHKRFIVEAAVAAASAANPRRRR